MNKRQVIKFTYTLLYLHHKLSVSPENVFIYLFLRDLNRCWELKSNSEGTPVEILFAELFPGKDLVLISMVNIWHENGILLILIYAIRNKFKARQFIKTKVGLRCLIFFLIMNVYLFP